MHRKLSTITLILLPLIAMIVALAVGRIGIPVLDIFESILNKIGFNFNINRQTEIILWSVRLPRILLAVFVGAGLSVAGCAFQSLFSNPLATPDTLGVASGASFGAALALLLGCNLIGVQFIALFFGIVAVILTFISGSGRNTTKTTFVLAGIMISSLFSALVSLVKYLADTDSQLPSIIYWLMGSLSSAGYNTLVVGLPIIFIAITILLLIRYKLNILPLAEEEAKSLGINVRSLRIVTVICATAITATCVSMCGQVGWVGLIVPHICRMKFGNNHMKLIPTAVSIGATFMVIVDTIARSMSATEIPISIITAIIGAPFFIILMKKSGGWKL